MAQGPQQVGVLAALLMTVCVSAQTPPAPLNDQWLQKPVDDRTFATFLDFFTYDRKLPLDVKVTKTEDDQGLRRERLSFQSTPGVRVTAILLQPTAGSPSNLPALVLLHGGTALGKDSPGGIRGAELLSRAGWVVLAIDLLYYGERSTSLMTTFSDQEKHERLYNQASVYVPWITQTVKDVSRSTDFLVERGVDVGRIGLFGVSRGANVGTIAAAIDRRLSPVVVFYGGHADAGETTHVAPSCPANYIGRIAPRPLLMVNGTQDAVMVKDSSVDPLFKLAKQPKQSLWTDGGHGFTTEDHWAQIIRWMKDHTK